MCGLEALMLALKLASDLVEPRYDPNVAITSINAVCGCGCLTTHSEQLRCQAAELESQAERIAAHNAKVKEFRQILRKCKVKID